MQTPAIPLLMDVDTGIDDSLALLYAAASPEAELVAVTCTYGNIELQPVVENTLAVLELAGRGDVEVAAGADRPLIRPLVTTPETHGPRGIGHATLPRAKASVSSRTAVDVIVQGARSRPGELTLLTLGPLTNLAAALEVEPRLPGLLKRWVMMGGTFGHTGNTTPTSEWNVHCDPDAAKRVFAAWGRAVEADPATPRGLVLGLDVTERARLLPANLEAITRAAPGTPIARFVEDALRFYFEFHQQYDGFYGAFVHDPLVTAVTLDPTLVETVATSVDVETQGELTTGQTIADRRNHWGRAASIDLAVGVAAETVMARLVERIGGLARS